MMNLSNLHMYACTPCGFLQIHTIITGHKAPKVSYPHFSKTICAS